MVEKSVLKFVLKNAKAVESIMVRQANIAIADNRILDFKTLSDICASFGIFIYRSYNFLTQLHLL